jgi:hypothetical protein
MSAEPDWAGTTRSRVRTTFSGQTAWARSLPTPLREFLSTETGSAVVLLGAALAALAWANIDLGSYTSFWHTRLSVRIGDSGIALDLRHWVNSGLMTFFFFVVGLEVRREFDIGELRERRRLALPVAAGLGGMLVPVAIYLAINAGDPSAGVFMAGRSFERKPPFPLQYAPPPDVGPAEAAYVVTEKVDQQAFVASMLWAAQQGAVGRAKG